MRHSNDIDFIEVNKAHKREYTEICEKLAELEERREATPEEDRVALSVRIRRLTRRRIAVENEFVSNNLGLAKSHAERYRTVYPDSRFDEDYHAAARYAIWEAFLRWNPEASAFSTYARMWIEGQIRKEVCINEFPQLSYPDFKARLKVLSSRDSIQDHEGSSAVTDERIAADTGVTTGVVERVLRPVPMRLDRSVGTDDPDGATLGDKYLGSDDTDTAEPLDLPPEAVKAILGALDPVEAWVVVRAHGLDGGPPHPVFWIAAMLGIPTAEVRSILDRSLSAVRQAWPVGSD